MIAHCCVCGCRAWLDGRQCQLIEWLLPEVSARDASMPLSVREQFNSAVKLSEAMLRSLKERQGMQGPLKATVYTDPEPVGAFQHCCTVCMDPQQRRMSNCSDQTV